MILPYGAGGVPGRGEIPMSSVSSRTPVDFLLRMNIYVDVTDALKKKEITAFDDYMTTKLET